MEFIKYIIIAFILIVACLLLDFGVGFSVGISYSIGYFLGGQSKKK